MARTKYPNFSSREFVHRERTVRHHRYDEELKFLTRIKEGDRSVIDDGVDSFLSVYCGVLSEDKVKNYKYLFICCITLITRFAIEGGMDEEYAFNASDFYIQNVERCSTYEDIIEYYRKMLTFYVEYMAALKKKNIMSKPVILCIDYIYDHIHEKISLQDLAKHADINPNYLCSVFKREVGMTIAEYITEQRVEAAKQMLLYSDMGYAEVASSLGFSSQSYFCKVFRQVTGYSPREYKKGNFQIGFEKEREEQKLNILQ